MITLGPDYGLTSMTFEEEVNLPETVRQTRNNKVQIYHMCESMKRTIDNIEYRAHHCPELEDEQHAALVEEFRNRVHRAMEMLDYADMTGRE